MPHGLNKPKECNTSAFSINTSLDTGITNNYTKVIHSNTKTWGNICNEQFYLHTILNDQSAHISETQHLRSFQRKTLTSALGDPSSMSMMKSATQGKL